MKALVKISTRLARGTSPPPDLERAFVEAFLVETQERMRRNDYPMTAVFKVAHAFNLTVLVQKRPESYWTEKQMLSLLEKGELEGPYLVDVLSQNRPVCSFLLEWPDEGEVTLACVRDPKKLFSKTRTKEIAP